MRICQMHCTTPMVNIEVLNCVAKKRKLFLYIMSSPEGDICSLEVDIGSSVGDIHGTERDVLCSALDPTAGVIELKCYLQLLGE
jgi:hypothetical protein